MARGLNAKQNQFCAEYLIDGNATKSAERAGYSKRTAGKQGHDLLQKPEIKAKINELKAAREKRTGVTADMVVKELARIAFGSVCALFNEDGTLKSPHDLEPDVAATIAAIEVKEKPVKNRHGDIEIEQIRKIKAWDKVKALELLGKHLRMFADVHVHEVSISDRLQRARRRHQPDAATPPNRAESLSAN